MGHRAGGIVDVRVWAAAASFAVGVLLGCGDLDPGLPDGARCTEDDQCGSQRCEVEGFDEESGEMISFCHGRACRSDGDCADGWRCHTFNYEATFLGILNDGSTERYCVAPCDACPDEFSCTGEWCRYDPTWGTPVVTVDEVPQAAIGDTITLHATAVSPIDVAITDYVWTFLDGSQAMGATVEHVLAETDDASAYGFHVFQVALTVSDADGHSAATMIEVPRCSGAGGPCGVSEVPDCCGMLACFVNTGPVVDPGDCRPHP